MHVPHSPDDQTLIDRINGGDAGAFAGLYDRYKSWVMRLARRHAPTEADAQDVVQETFMYLLRKSPGLELRARMTTFLYPVVRNLARTAAARAPPALAHRLRRSSRPPATRANRPNSPTSCAVFPKNSVKSF